MNLPILIAGKSHNLHDFIEQWSQFYSFPNGHLYNIIYNKRFRAKDIQDLFEWKNGMRLSERKQDSLNGNVLRYLNEINHYKSSDVFEKDEFLNTFYHLTAVWKIFLLHIIRPRQYPIYDQHIHRAYRFIQNQEFSNVTSSSISNKNKEKFYFEEYLPFIQVNSIQNLKKMDEAFFAFGKFLKTANYGQIFNT